MSDNAWFRSKTLSCLFALAVSLACLIAASPGRAGVVEDVRKRGELVCGVSEGLEGFSVQSGEKVWRGFDVDYCRAVATATVGDPLKVRFVPLSATTRFEALANGKIDLLARNTTWTLSRDVLMGFEFVGVNYYDGQGFMTRRDNGLSSALQLGQATICVLEGTTSQANAARYFAENKIDVTFKLYKDREALVGDYGAKTCDAYTADVSGLASDRTRLKEPDAHMLLPEVISKEPLGPVIRQGDTQWSTITRWVLFLLINAEERGWTKATAAKDAIELPAEVSAKLGLDKQWARKVIESVGNYGEIFDRNIGKDSRLGLPRGVNALWTRGGILYAPPLR